MTDTIGATAGRIWGLLVEHGELTTGQVVKRTNAPRDVVQRAIGWLAREDKLVFVADVRPERIRLK